MKKSNVGWSILMAVFLVASIGFPAWGADEIKIGIGRGIKRLCRAIANT